MKLLSRRTLLRGAGVGIALPVLEAMLDGRGLLHGTARAGGANPARMILFHWPQGLPVGWGAVDGGFWYPTSYGSGWTVTPGLQPLADLGLVGDINVIDGLTYRQISNHVGSHGHSVAYMTGYAALPESPGSAEPTTQGPSVDQVAAARIGGATKFRSITTGLYDQGEGWWSWSDAGVRAPLELDPVLLYNRLFSDLELDPDAALAAAARTKSVLDFVADDIGRLQGQLGSADRSRLDEHLTTIRELEKQLDFTPSADCSLPPQPGAVAYGDGDCDAYAKLMIDLVVMALRCDLTRVAFVSLGPSQNYRTFPHLGIPYTYHNICHSGGANGGPDIDADGGDRDALYRDIALWHMQILAYFLDRLRGADEASNLLTDAAFVASSEFSSGGLHYEEFVPAIVAGKLGGMATGNVMALPCSFPEAWQTPPWCDQPGPKSDVCINDLWTTALRAVGALDEGEIFGDPTLPTTAIPGLWTG
ncbi:MAG: DUF1552 domain-containing protein [Nannocystaceae bacterium]